MKKYVFWAVLIIFTILSLGSFVFLIISKNTFFAILGVLFALAVLLTYREKKSIDNDPFLK
jgi:hypothetical protein